MDAISSQSDLSLLAAALNDLGIDVDQIAMETAADQGTGQFTFFAPGDDALNALDPAVRDNLLSNADALRQLLSHSIVGTRIHSSDFESEGLTATTMDGTQLDVKLVNSEEMVMDPVTGTDAQLLLRDITAGDGLIQVVDKALLPSTA
jgi:uncharacterized surface protein with fasciclin (FAS1) repeats